MITDPIGDFIIRIKNAGAVKHESIALPYSKVKAAVADVLSKAGFVGSVEKKGKGTAKTLTVGLLYKKNGSPRVEDVKRISKPGRRIYKSVKEIFPVRYGKGALILSTSKGIMTNSEAKKAGLGGEALFEIW